MAILLPLADPVDILTFSETTIGESYRYSVRGNDVHEGVASGVGVQQSTQSQMVKEMEGDGIIATSPWPERWVANLLPLADSVDILAVAHAFRLLTCNDPAVKEIRSACVRRVVKCKPSQF